MGDNKPRVKAMTLAAIPAAMFAASQAQAGAEVRDIEIEFDFDDRGSDVFTHGNTFDGIGTFGTPFAVVFGAAQVEIRAEGPDVQDLSSLSGLSGLSDEQFQAIFGINGSLEVPLSGDQFDECLGQEGGECNLEVGDINLGNGSGGLVNGSEGIPFFGAAADGFAFNEGFANALNEVSFPNGTSGGGGFLAIAQAGQTNVVGGFAASGLGGEASFAGAAIGGSLAFSSLVFDDPDFDSQIDFEADN